MEDTSGAADPDLLRGSSGEAALGPRVAVPAQAGAVARAGGTCAICASRSPRCVPSACRPRVSGPRGGSREPHVPRWPREQGLARRDRCGRSVQRVWADGHAASESPADVAAISRREVSERIGLGRSSRHRPSLRARPMRHETLAQRVTRGAGQRELAGPWPVKPRLAPAGSRSRAARLAEGRRCGRHPDSAVDVADGASTPFGGSPPSPARAGRGPSAGASRGSGGRAVVLVDCSGCRSRREASGPSRSPRGETSVEALGLAIRPRARVVKGRPKPVCGGKAARTVAGSHRSRRVAQAVLRGSGHSSREGVLAPKKPSSLTRRRWRRAWQLRPVDSAERPKKRGGAATEGVRGHVASSARG